MRLLHSQLLRYLDEVARIGSIRKASEKLNIASSSINRQILALEAELGSPIFDRLHRRMRLTATGEVLISHVRRTLEDLARAETQIDDIKGLDRGEVSVALVGGLATSFISQVGASFQEQHPRMKLNFKRLAINDIVSAVTSGECDLGLSFRMPEASNLKTIAAIDCHIGAVMARDHPLAKRSAVRLSDCVGYPMVLPDMTMFVRQTIDPVFGRLGMPLWPVMESNSIEMIRGFVATGQGISFLNQINIHDERTLGTLRFIPIIDRCPPLTLKIVRRASDQVPLVTSLLANMMRIAIQELEPGAPSVERQTEAHPRRR